MDGCCLRMPWLNDEVDNEIDIWIVLVNRQHFLIQRVEHALGVRAEEFKVRLYLDLGTRRGRLQARAKGNCRKRRSHDQMVWPLRIDRSIVNSLSEIQRFQPTEQRQIKLLGFFILLL